MEIDPRVFGGAPIDGPAPGGEVQPDPRVFGTLQPPLRIDVNGVATPEEAARIVDKAPTKAADSAPIEGEAPKRSNGGVKMLQDLQRQLSLTGRAVAQGAAGMIGTFADPLTASVNLATRQEGDYMPLPSELMKSKLDEIFAEPETPTEKVVNAGASAGFGGMMGGGMAKLAGEVPAAIRSAGPMVNSMAQRAGQHIDALRQLPGQIAAAPVQNSLAAAGAGVGQSGAQEAGLSKPWQIAAGMAAGVAGGAGAATAGRAISSASALSQVAKQQGVTPLELVAIRAKEMIKDSGVKFEDLPIAARSRLMEEAKQSIITQAPIAAGAGQRFAQFQSVGVNPTRAFLTRDARDWAKEDRLAKHPDALVGAPIRGAREDAGRAVRETIDPQGDPLPSDSRTGDVIKDVLGRSRQLLSDVKSSLYKQAGDSPEGKVGVDVSPLRQFLNGFKDSKSQPQYSDVLDQLERLSTDGRITRKNLEEVRQYSNSLRSNDGGPADNAVKSINKTIDDMITQVDDRGGAINRQYQTARKVNTRLNTDFKDQGVIDDLTSMVRGSRTDVKTQPADVYSRIMRGGEQAIRQVRDTLAKSGPEGKQAWEVFQTRTVRDLKESLNTVGTGENKPTTFLKKMEDLDESLETIFGAEQAMRLRAMKAVVENSMIPPRGLRDNSNPSGTAGQLMGYLHDMGWKPLTATMDKWTMGTASKLRDVAQAATDKREAMNLADPSLRLELPKSDKITSKGAAAAFGTLLSDDSRD